MGNEHSCVNSNPTTRITGSPFAFATNPSHQICAGNMSSQNSGPVLHCHDATSPSLRNAFTVPLTGFGNKPYPYIDPNNIGCKFKTDQEAYACCTSFTPGVDQIKNSCADAFMPSATTGSSLCQPFMLAICETNWESPACQPYLDSWQQNRDVYPVVQTTIANYINSMADRYKCTYIDGPMKGQPGTNDYTTPLINRRCQLADNSLRDDSKDDFINNTLIHLCTTEGGDSRGGICDDILQQYCAQFQRQDLYDDPTLLKICGCHLPVVNQGPVQKCQGQNAPKTCLTGINPTIQQNQYTFPATPSQCDPICVTAGTIQREGPSCTQTVCIMENVDTTLINSACKGGITISQVCGDDGAGTKTGNCYMSNVDINLINSTCGGIFLDQQCNACFTFPPDKPWESTQVSCCDPSNSNGGKCDTSLPPPIIIPPPKGGPPPVVPPKGGGGTTTQKESWLKKNAIKIGIAIVIIGFLILAIGLVFHFNRREPATLVTGSDVSPELPSNDLDLTLPVDPLGAGPIGVDSYATDPLGPDGDF
jgi:hypothetical protein